MKFFLDTEFHEYARQPKFLGMKVGKPINTIELISIGIVAEDGREYSAISKDFDVKAAWNNKWLRENVLWTIFCEDINTFCDPFELWYMVHLIEKNGKTREQIASDIAIFMGHRPEVYAYFADYDWVVTCWLFGRMIDLPESFPFHCLDLKQMMVERGLDGNWKDLVCPQDHGKHQAIFDARWNRFLYEAIMRTSPTIA